MKKKYLKVITDDPLIHTMDHPKFVVSNQKEDSISIQRVNGNHGEILSGFHERL